MREWRIEHSDTLLRHHILDLERRRLAAGDDRREVLVMRSPDWINVIPLLDDGRVVLIRQWRYGIQAPTLEIPGGMVDPGEEPRQAAARELVEETGYRAGKLRFLGSSHPNPAFIANRISSWLATDLTEVTAPAGTFGVEGEEIVRETAPLARIPELIRSGEISHSLVIVAFHLLALDRERGPARSRDRPGATG